MIRRKNGIAVRKPPGDTFTVWGNPNERFESQYGLVTYREWCEKEIERIGRKVEIRDDGDGVIALAPVSEDSSVV